MVKLCHPRTLDRKRDLKKARIRCLGMSESWLEQGNGDPQKSTFQLGLWLSFQFEVKAEWVGNLRVTSPQKVPGTRSFRELPKSRLVKDQQIDRDQQNILWIKVSVFWGPRGLMQDLLLIYSNSFVAWDWQVTCALEITTGGATGCVGGLSALRPSPLVLVRSQRLVFWPGGVWCVSKDPKMETWRCYNQLSHEETLVVWLYKG